MAIHIHINTKNKRVKDAGSVDYLDAEQLMDEYGPTILARLNKGETVKVKNGILRKSGRGFTRTNSKDQSNVEEYRGYKIKQNSLNGKWYILDPKGTGSGKIGHVMGFNTLPEAKKKLDEHLD